VGKTFVAEALVRYLAARGHAVAGLKPVETGCRTNAEGAPIEGDAARLEAASLLVKLPRPHPLYAFMDPVAPSLAARREGQAVQAEAIVSWMDRVRSVNHAELALVIETAGGVFSPVSDTTSNFDLAQSLGDAQWVLVAPDRLGVLHEVRATLVAMKSLGRSPDWLVLNAAETPDSSSGTNAAELQRLGVTLPTVLLRRGDPTSLAPLLGAVLPILPIASAAPPGPFPATVPANPFAR
jgi:dethiobiotin synthetase